MLHFLYPYPPSFIEQKMEIFVKKKQKKNQTFFNVFLESHLKQ
jgi:hypothetical protein